MRIKKTIDTSISEKLAGLSEHSQALYLNLWLKSDDAGLVRVGRELICRELVSAGLVSISKHHIIIRGYFSANYGKQLNPAYGPTKPVFKCMDDAGYQYDTATNEILIAEGQQIDFDSLYKVLDQQDHTISHPVTESALNQGKQAKFNVIQTIKSGSFALVLSLFLMIAQSIHTAFTLISLSHLPSPYNEVAAIFTALLVDGLIIYFVANGKGFQSGVFFVFCSLMGLYSYHLNTDYWTYKSIFAIVVSVAVPYAVHSVSLMAQENKEQAKAT